MTMHYTRTDKFKEEIQRILELVIYSSQFDGVVHSACQRRVGVGVKKESVCDVYQIGVSTEKKQQNSFKSGG